MEIRDFKIVVKTFRRNNPLYSVPTSSPDDFHKTYGFDSIKSLEFLTQWGYQKVNDVSAFRMTPGVWATVRPSEYVWIRSVCTGEVLEDGNTVSTGPAKYGNKNQLWKIEFVHNPFAYPYIYAVISNCASHKCLTAQRRDDILEPRGSSLSWCEDRLLTDRPRSRKAIIGSVIEDDGIWPLIKSLILDIIVVVGNADPHYRQKWNLLLYGKVFMLINEDRRMAAEVCLQHKTLNRCPVTLASLRFQRRQAWIIQAPPSPHSDFILFTYRAGYLSVNKESSSKKVQAPAKVSAVLYNRNLVDSIAQFCSPVPY